MALEGERYVGESVRMGRRIEGKKDDRDGEWKESRKGEEVVGEEE